MPGRTPQYALTQLLVNKQTNNNKVPELSQIEHASGGAVDFFEVDRFWI